jgi:LmbE family N-acetylglucosaminyl deacetylase
VRRVCVISTHADDAVLSCGQFIAGRSDTTVVTVLAGFPPDSVTVTDYDTLCGFSTSKDAIAVRRAEDREALAYLKATPVHLEHLDSQYGAQDRKAIAADIKRLVDEGDYELVVAGLGLRHPDHELVREAVIDALQDVAVPLWLYEDLPARVTAPETVPAAVAAIHKRGLTTELGFIGTGSLADKCLALWSYRSQMGLPDFANRHHMLVEERFWRVSKAVTPEERA